MGHCSSIASHLAANERPRFSASMAGLTLTEQLANVLPKDTAFKLYHVSTAPTFTSALYSAPPGKEPERTFCESHFLAVAINTKDDTEVIVFAIEVLIYSTASSTTIFVSKADSSGYLHLLELPKGSSSPLKEISSTFLAYLVENRRRQGILTVVSLFARAQDQYLFPGSIENKGKHVLDDRGLLKWWCRILHSLLRDGEGPGESEWESVRGYLAVPGLDKYDTKSFVPKSERTEAWTVGHPLREISSYSSHAPPRCFIPHFPDDPKARFMDTLDEELADSDGQSSGEWKSVKSLETFWEMMAFRQECAAGRLVGFVWIVFKPRLSLLVRGNTNTNIESQSSIASGLADAFDEAELPTLPEFDRPLTSTTLFALPSEDRTPMKSRQRPSSRRYSRSSLKKKKLSGPIVPRQPRVKTRTSTQSNEMTDQNAYYVWPADSRGQVVLEEKDYKRMDELLLSLDFANLELAVEGTQRWVSEVRSVAPGKLHSWGTTIIGLKAPELKTETATTGITMMNMGLVRKKRKAGSDADTKESAPAAPKVNVLEAAVIRKKVKA